MLDIYFERFPKGIHSLATIF
ncbi:hypothetical protein BVI2075_780035 [Burkholderia vietnamiensis]|nr:hypothetical protein BVI2075_780035 [Burkholderia vietnamiensis]